MDKYEFNIKVEQIKKLVNKGDYETAMKIADTIDWRRVRSTSLLSMVAQVYERNEEYQDAKEILLLAFERAPLGKGLLFKLTDLALREGNIQEAEAYYREFCELSGDDPRQNLLRYLILEAKEAPVEQQINSLERYCYEELDEKWMYHLAELYKEAGREDDCIRICDKIMLMFGLGKYVDKAMELKLQYAPLTKYQMDLVENREKYEEKLRAVEEEYKTGRYTNREEEYYDSEDGENEVLDAGEDDAMAFTSETPAAEGEALEAESAMLETAVTAEQPVFEAGMDEELKVSFHEEEAKEELARSVSKLTPYEEEESSPAAETRIFRNVKELHEQRMENQEFADGTVMEEDEETLIEDWDLEAVEENSNHLMIEAEIPEKGLALALESLKKIHRELGSKNPVAKISGDKLSRKGIFAVADRLAGKDLVVEHAADLGPAAIQELITLMERDETGIIVVLIDTPIRMEQLHRGYPALADKFQYIGCEPGDESSASLQGKNAALQAEYEAEEARKRLAEREEEIRRQAARDAEEARRLQAIREEEARRRAEMAEAEARRREEEARYRAEIEAEEARRQAEYEAAEAARCQAEYEAAEAARYQAGYEAAEAARYQAGYEAAETVHYQAGYEDEGMIRRQPEEEPHFQWQYESDRDYDKTEAAEALEGNEAEEEYAGEELPDDGAEMDVEEFVQYACRYASEIDCSISGKSMLALYERAEMMEEDGEPLTRTNAEDLIEEAADKAEKKSFGGLFSSKYDKDGLLILKEKHFFD